MQTILNQRADVWDSEHGCFINQDHQRFAEILEDIDPYLCLVWIPPKERDGTNDKPYAVLHQPPGLEPYVVRWISELEMNNPTAILDNIFQSNTAKFDPIKALEDHETHEQMMQLKREEDRIEDDIQLGVFLAKTPLHTFKHNGQIYRK